MQPSGCMHIFFFMEPDFFISMLADEDEANASIAIRELLKYPDLQRTIAEYQDSDDPLVCRRIHQLASIKNRLDRMAEFPRLLDAGKLTHWQALSTINVIVDTRTSFQQLDDMLPKLLGDDIPIMRSPREFCNTIRDLGFSVDETNDNFIVKYLLMDAMASFSGDPLVVGVICQQLGALCGWNTTLGRLDNHVCLRDRFNNLCSLHPDDIRFRSNIRHFKPVSVRELSIEILGKIHSAACIDQVTSVFLDTRTLLEQLQAQ